MPDAAAIEHDGVLDLNRLTNMATIADAGVAADVTIWTNLAVATDHHISLDENSRQNPRAFADMDQALDYRHRVHFAIDDAFIERADPCFVGAQKIPWIANEKRFARGNRIASSIKPPRNLLTRCVEQRAAFACGKQRHFVSRQPCVRMNAKCRGTHHALLVRGQGNVANGEITNRTTKGQRMTVACFEFHEKKSNRFPRE